MKNYLLIISCVFFSWNKRPLARSSRKNRVQQRKDAFLKTVHGGDAE